MWVLIIRDECERVCRLKFKRMKKWILRVSHKKLTCEIATCREHDWKVKSDASLKDFVSVSQVRPSYEILAKHSVWQNVMFLFYQVFVHTIYTLITHIL